MIKWYFPIDGVVGRGGGLGGGGAGQENIQIFGKVGTLLLSHILYFLSNPT